MIRFQGIPKDEGAASFNLRWEGKRRISHAGHPVQQGTVCSVSIPLGNGVVQEEWSAEHTAQGDPLSQLSSAPEDIQKG